MAISEARGRFTEDDFQRTVEVMREALDCGREGRDGSFTAEGLAFKLTVVLGLTTLDPEGPMGRGGSA